MAVSQKIVCRPTRLDKTTQPQPTNQPNKQTTQPNKQGPALPTLLAAAEIVRRGLWCLLRLEAAHLSLYRPSKAVGARGGRRARRGNQAEEEEEGEEEGAGVEMVVGRSGGWEGEDEELLWDEEEQEQEQQGPVDVDPLEVRSTFGSLYPNLQSDPKPSPPSHTHIHPKTARLLTQEEARRANPSGHPTGRLVQVRCSGWCMGCACFWNVRCGGSWLLSSKGCV